mmetsp:Transcript_96494/g.249500  ORF Transcript_96494/g.249500 Transcript_96494/m.249500 type:complete len:333 (-) Transcript_96494:606-1604(-)
MILRQLLDDARLHHLALGHVQEVGRPALQVVEDVRAVEDCGTTQLGLGTQEGEDALAREDVEVRGDLIHQVHGAWRAQDLQQLAAPTLAVGEVIDLPVQVDLQDISEVLAPLCAGDLVTKQFRELEVHEEVRPPPVTAVHHLPAHGRVVEAVLPEDAGQATADHALAAQNRHQRGLACPVGADDKDPRSPAKGDCDVLEHGWQARSVGVRQVVRLEHSALNRRHNTCLLRSLLRICVHGRIILLEDPLAHQCIEGHSGASSNEVMVLLEVRHGAAPGNLGLGEVQHVRSPVRKAIEDVCGVEDSRTLLLCLLAEEPEQALTRVEVQICRDLI